MHSIFSDPIKLPMLIILLILEIPALGILIWIFRRDMRRWREKNEQSEDAGTV